MRKFLLALCIVLAISMFTGCEMEEIATLNSVLTEEVSWPKGFAGIARSSLKKAWGAPSEITESSDTWYVDGTYVKVIYEENGRVLATYPAQIRNPYEIKIVENK